MKFKDRLLQGSFIKRYKRFFVDINFKGKIITAHCPNPGSMMGLLNKGNKAWFSKTNNPKRKLQYTLQIIEAKNNCLAVLKLTDSVNLYTKYINPEDRIIFNIKYDIPTIELKYKAKVIIINNKVKKTT